MAVQMPNCASLGGRGVQRDEKASIAEYLTQRNFYNTVLYCNCIANTFEACAPGPRERPGARLPSGPLE